jgi:hypothetical protein
VFLVRTNGLWVIAALAVGSVCVQAQWLNHPSPGTPRTKDGKPNLKAPAPRTPGGRPDLSGIWQAAPSPIEEMRAFLPPDEGPPIPGEPAPSKYFLNVLADFKPEDNLMKPAAAALFKQRFDAFGKDNPSTSCLPLGLPLMDYAVFPHKIVQTPDVVVVLYEALTMFRQVYTDGRKLPVDPEPAFAGYSIGKWDGDTLVVEAAGFRDGGWLDAFGHPHSDAMRLTERFRRLNFGTMEVQVTVDDPKSYTKPFTIKFNKQLYPDTDLLESFCENEKDRQHLK